MTETRQWNLTLNFKGEEGQTVHQQAPIVVGFGEWDDNEKTVKVTETRPGIFTIEKMVIFETPQKRRFMKVVNAEGEFFEEVDTSTHARIDGLVIDGKGYNYCQGTAVQIFAGNTIGNGLRFEKAHKSIDLAIHFERKGNVTVAFFGTMEIKLPR